MRQIISGRCDSSKLRSYKVSIGKEATSSNKNMQPTDHRRALKKPKRLRSAFTTDQVDYLEKAYKRFPYVDREGRQHLASILKLGERPIKIWFQNRRMKEKKESQNHKEFDVEIQANDLQIGQHQLNNVPALPSTNDNRPNSLPMLSPIADSTIHTKSMEANKIDLENKPSTQADCQNITISVQQKNTQPKANFYNEIKDVVGELHRSPYFNQELKVDSTVSKQPQVTNEKRKSPSQEYDSTKSAEISINLCKKYKEERKSTETALPGNIVNDDLKMKPELPPALGPKKESNILLNNIVPNIGKNVGVPSHLPPPPKPPSHANMNNPIYYPVMSGVYPPPYIAHDGVLWKPVNFMPVMATNGPPAPVSNQALPVREGIKNCTCNCHSSPHVPVNFPPSFQNPYTQYVISVPFPHTSPNF